jgi:hypothetical protein
MTAVAAGPSSTARLVTGAPGRRFDHLFFSGMALLLLVTVFVGLRTVTIWPESSTRRCPA